MRLPALREGNDESRVLLFSNRGEVYLPCYVEEAESDDLLLLNQYSADRIISKIEAAVEYGDIDPSEGRWIISRDGDGLEVRHDLVTDTEDAM